MEFSLVKDMPFFLAVNRLIKHFTITVYKIMKCSQIQDILFLYQHPGLPNKVGQNTIQTVFCIFFARRAQSRQIETISGVKRELENKTSE